MGHHINALIGTPDALVNFVERFGSPAPTALSFGLVIIPLNETRLDTIATSPEPAIEGFTYLMPRMAQEVAEAVRGPALYIETEYFGGMGGQAAAYFEPSKLMWRAAEAIDAPAPTSGKSPISEGLSRLGVRLSDAHDEFDQIGLHRFRSLEALGIEYDD